MPIDPSLQERVARAARDLRIRERDALRTRALTVAALCLTWMIWVVWSWQE